MTREEGDADTASASASASAAAKAPEDLPLKEAEGNGDEGAPPEELGRKMPIERIRMLANWPRRCLECALAFGVWRYGVFFAGQCTESFQPPSHDLEILMRVKRKIRKGRRGWR
jgi:hypothetical protein